MVKMPEEFYFCNKIYPSPTDGLNIPLIQNCLSCMYVYCRLLRRLPAGHAHVCMEVASLPHILQQIFASSLLQTSAL